MSDKASDRHGVRVLACAADGPLLAGEDDAMEVIASGFGQEIDLIAIPATRFDDRFFTLSTRIAGHIVQKFVNYRVRLAIVGDITAYLEASAALRDFVAESNRGRHLWFVADLAELDRRLAEHATRN